MEDYKVAIGFKETDGPEETLAYAKKLDVFNKKVQRIIKSTKGNGVFFTTNT